MRNFNSFFLMDTDSVKDYAIDVLGFFSADEEINCSEIGDGNINYVFRLVSAKDCRSLVIKQADKLLRSSGRPLDTYRNKIEAKILQLQDELAPGFVPKVVHYDQIMCALVMEDISDYKNLRKELAAGKIYPELAELLSTFVADTLLPTTDLVLSRAEKKKRTQFFTNIELCDITEDLVLTEPYYNYKNRNIITEGNEEFVSENLYNNIDLHSRVAILRDNFMNNSQALIHGDLHTGSVFINDSGIKVIDPEFAFYGPMGYDIGNVIANLLFAYYNKLNTQPENRSFCEFLRNTVSDFFDLTFEKIKLKYDQLVELPLYRCEKFRDHYLRKIMSDSIGYTGTEIIRRTVGDSKVSDITSVVDPQMRIKLERQLIMLGIKLIMNSENIQNGSDLLEII